MKRKKEPGLPRPILIVCRCGALIVVSDKKHEEQAKDNHFNSGTCDRETFDGWTIHDSLHRVRSVQ